MKKVLFSLLASSCMLVSNAQAPATSNTLGTTGITAINSTTNAAFKLSINGSTKQYGTGDGTGAATAVVVSPTIFLANTTATTGKQYSINSNNAGFFRIADAVGTTTFTATDRFVIAPTTGFIGIGNSAPTARLHITGSGTTATTNAFLVNNSAAINLFTIKDDGNVGIGVATPTQKLDVAGNVNFSGALMPGSNAGVAGSFLKSNGAGVAPTWVLPDAATNTAWGLAGNANATATSFVGTTTANDLVLKANNIEGYRISSVDGVSTISNPTNNTPLVINGNNISGAVVKVNSNSTNPGTLVGYRFAVNNIVKSQIFFDEGLYSFGTALDGLVGNTEVLSRTGDVVLSTNIFRTNPVILKNTTGYFGIGTLTPNNKVEITHGTAGNSGLRFTNLTAANTAAISSGKVLSVNANGDVVLEVAGAATTADGSETKLTAGSNVSVSGIGTTASPYVISANVPTAPASQWVASSIGTGNIVNANTGAVVIGSTLTALPTGYKLYVADGILAEKVKVALKSGTNWADYVFNKNYKLAPLAEVEAFINKNKHLPGVQSADEIVKNGGIDVNQMFAKQMEKIEELTLYIIEQNKKIQALEKAVKNNNK
jgi:trimeric autotransporter adhesin